MSGASREYASYIVTTPRELWRALTTPDMTRLYFDFMKGFMSVRSDWQPGSSIEYHTDDEQVHIEGTVLEVEPDHRLLTTISLLYDPDVCRDAPSWVEWRITELNGVCKLIVTHSKLVPGSHAVRDMAVCMPSILANLKVLLETGSPRLIKEIVFDCQSPAVLGLFWVEALRYVMQGTLPTDEDTFVAIADPRGVGPELGFQRVAQPKQGKNRVHFDLHVADVTYEVQRLISLGAQRVPGYPQTESHVVLADPEGNEFCVVTG